MSGTGENRHWRRTSTQPPQQMQQQRQTPGPDSGANIPRGGAQQQTAMNAVPGNVWGEGGKAKPGLRGGEMGVAAGAPVAARATQAAVQEKHVPVREFNAVEVREFLKKRYQEAISGQPSAYHKVAGDSVAKRNSGAWGSRGNMSHQMPNGQDFFTQLKKQLQTLEVSKG